MESTRGDNPALVWLYRLVETDTLVGFGAVARAEWSWTRGSDPKVPVTLILWFGVSREFHGQPPGPAEERYAGQIVRDLMAYAHTHAATHPVVGLLVGKDNERAIQLYRAAGFSDENLREWTDSKTKRVYKRMARVLSPRILQELLAKAREAKKPK